MSLLENKLENRTIVSDDEKCWPGKGRREQVGWEEGLGRRAEGAKE